METQAHGALIEVGGVGVLLLGRSGIGKSECALELVTRGHRLVADDVVRVEARSKGTESVLVGSAPEVIRHYMEIRGIGLLYLPDLFGEEAVAEEGPIDLVCHLQEWRQGVEYERLGFERKRHEMAGVSLPALTLPGRPAGSMATLVEVAARDHRLRAEGRSGASRMNDEWLRRRAREAGQPAPEGSDR